MALASESAGPYWPLGLYFVLVVVLAAGMIALSYVLGERHRERATGLPYESGMPPTGGARIRFPVDFYLVAMFFVIFDVESIFLFVWAVAVRQLGWAGYVEVLVFITVLLAALAYLWRNGALDWHRAQTGMQTLPRVPQTRSSVGGMGIPGTGRDDAPPRTGS